MKIGSAPRYPLRQRRLFGWLLFRSQALDESNQLGQFFRTDAAPFQLRIEIVILDTALPHNVDRLLERFSAAIVKVGSSVDQTTKRGSLKRSHHFCGLAIRGSRLPGFVIQDL